MSADLGGALGVGDNLADGLQLAQGVGLRVKHDVVDLRGTKESTALGSIRLGWR